MIKILIVDDESPIREWIKYCIDNSFDSGFYTELASNGYNALEKFEANHHDIVITDIRMPVLDGLSLIDKIRTMDTNTCIMILTSHSDFEYARTAMKYQIFDYILKTEITEEYLINILNKYLDSIKTDSSLAQSYINREAVMHKLIDPQFDEDKVTVDLLRKYNIPLQDTAFFSFAVKYNANDISFQNGLNINNLQQEKIKNIFGFCYEKNTFIFCANIVSTNSLSAQTRILNEFITEFYNTNNKCSMGVSPIFHSVRDLSRSIHHATYNLSLSFYRKNTIINNPLPPEQDQVLYEVARLKTDVISSISSKNENIIKSKLYEFFTYIKSQEPGDINMVKSNCIKLVEEIIESKVLLSRKKSSDEVMGIKAKINRAADFHQVQNLVINVYTDMLMDHKSKDRNYSNTILKAINYLEKHYQTITGLNEVANIVYLNPEYFSRLFKSETGLNFSSYLNNYRLNKSLDLLMNTNLKVYEIAQLVGYSSLSYYSKMFKNKYRVNPFNYRNNMEDLNSV